MAFCPNCGANLPDGSAFCTNCGARLARAAAPAAAPAARPAYAGAPAPRPSKKSRKGLILGLVAVVLLAAIALGVLFLTGVLGGGKGLTGVWTLASSNDSTMVPGKVSLVLTKDGKGYFSQTSQVAGYMGEYTETWHVPVTWTDSILLLSGQAATYTRDKDSLTVMLDGGMLVFTRTAKTPEKRTALKTGTYVMSRVMEEGQEYTSEYSGPGASTILLQDGFGTMTYGHYTETVLWDDYFLTIDGDSVFYTFDGSTLMLDLGWRQMYFTYTG